MITLRGKSARNCYATARGFGLGRAHAAYRTLRFLLTGRTGRYAIRWRPQGKDQMCDN